MFKKGSSLGELFGIKQQQGQQQQQQQQQQQNSSNANSRQQQRNSSSTTHPSSTATTIANNNNVVPSSIQDLGKVYDRAKDLLEKTRQRNQLGFEENNPDIEKRQFARLNEIRRLTNAMKTSVHTTQGNTMFEDVNEKMAWEQQVKYFEEDLESAVEVAMRVSGGATMPNASPMFAGMNVAASNAPEEFAFSPPVNDLRTPPPVATTAPPVMVDLFAGLNVTPTPAAAEASPLPPAPHPEKEEEKVAEEKREIDFEGMMPSVQTSAMEVTTTTTNIKTTVEDSDRNKIAHDDDDDRNKTSSSIGFGLQQEALPLDEDAFGDFRDASSAADVPPLPTSAVVEPSVQPLDDEDEDGFFPREEEAVEIPSMEELQQQGGLTSGLDDALDESDDFLEDYASATLMHEAVISPPAVVETHPINPPINKASASANTTMLRIPSFTNEDVPIGNSPGAKRFQQKTKFARETKVSAEALAKGEEEGEEKTKVNSVEAIANAVESERVVSDIVEKGHFPGSRSPDESPKVSTPVLSPAHSYGGGGGGGSGGDSGSLQTRESTSEPFTPVYSRVTTPTLELSPDAMIPISPGSPMIFNSQDQDFILQNFGIQRVALDLEVANEVDKVVEAAESYVRMRRLSWENAQRLKMEASNKRLSSATNATQHLKRKSELQKQQDDAIRNDDFELAADVEEKLNSLSKQIKDTEDALNAAELQHAERVRASLSALNEWAHAEIEASNNIDKFVSDKEEKWAREKEEEEEARKKVAAAEAAAAASSNNTSSEHERLVLRATETEDALKLAVEKSRENEAKTSEIEDERKAMETKVNELKEALQIAENELEHLANKAALESANAEKANRLVSSCRETHETSKAALESYNEKVREEERKEAHKQQMQGGTSSETEELIGKMKERSELYRRAGSERLQTTEESSISDELQQLVIHETTNTILSSEAQSELKREESDNARINADLANALSQERDCQTRLTILERRKNELLALKQSHAAAKSFKEASECVNELNAKILPELEQLNTLLVQKKRTVESLQLQFSESETKVGLCREKFREAEKVCAQSRKVRLQTELNTKNSSEDESEVEALKCALELLVLKHPEV